MKIPQAADSLGINVYKMRYAGTTISGALAGMGGFVYALTTANCTANGDVASFGFLALAVMIFGNWKPLNIAGASLLFRPLQVRGGLLLQHRYQRRRRVSPGGRSASAPFYYRMLPYLSTLIVLAFTSKSPGRPRLRACPTTRGEAVSRKVQDQPIPNCIANAEKSLCCRVLAAAGDCRQERT